MTAPARHSGDRAAPRIGVAHRVALALVWLTVASGAIVFTEPAPFDIAAMGLLILLPAVGLLRATPTLIAYMSAMLVPVACAFIATLMAIGPERAITHTTVTLFLVVVSLSLSAFVVASPVRHARLIAGGAVAAGLVASITGLVGYLNLVPGAYDLFTLYGRVSGTFKDPNVFGASLIFPTVYLMHVVLTGSPRRAWLAAFGVALLSLAVLLSFSRGAWFGLAMATMIYAYFSFVTARDNVHRLRILGSIGGALVVCSMLLAIALQFDAVASLLNERATLTQSYDEGPEGRFGGQQKAKQLILAHPFGLGAQQFDGYYHIEEAHNVYLSMFMNAGWLGGLLFAVTVAATCLFGARHALKRTATQGIFIVAMAAFVSHALEGFVIDLDHWRHFHLLMALVWGLMLGDRLPTRALAHRVGAQRIFAVASLRSVATGRATS